MNRLDSGFWPRDIPCDVFGGQNDREGTRPSTSVFPCPSPFHRPLKSATGLTSRHNITVSIFTWDFKLALTRTQSKELGLICV
jgi:hypothetical protein